MSQKQAAVARATAGKRCCCVERAVLAGARLGQSTRRGASALLEAAGAARAAWRRWYSQLSIGGRLTKTRGWSGPPILQHALHEPPGLHVLVAGDPGLWLLDCLQEVAAEPFEGLDQPLEVLLAQPRQLAGRRRHFGGGIRLVLGLRPVGDAWRPPREARSRPRAGACGAAGATAAGSDRGATDAAQSSRPAVSLFNFTQLFLIVAFF